MHLKVIAYRVTLMKIKNMIPELISYFCYLNLSLFCMINDQPFISSFFSSSMLFPILNDLPLVVLDFPFCL